MTQKERTFTMTRRTLFGFLAFLVVFLAFREVAFAQDVTGELDDSTPFQNWQIFLGFILGPIIAFVTKADWSPALKSGVMLLVSAVLTTVGMYLDGTLARGIDGFPVDWIAEVLKVAVATIAFYYGVWKPTGTTTAIHSKTG